MPEQTTITQEELQSLKGLRNEADQFVINLGEIQFQKVLFEAQEQKLKDGILDLKTREKAMVDSLVAKYGNVSIDIETGSIN